MNDQDFREDELITVQMTRGDYKVIMEMIERERAYSWFKNALRTNWIWVLAGGVLAVAGAWEKVAALISGVK